MKNKCNIRDTIHLRLQCICVCIHECLFNLKNINKKNNFYVNKYIRIYVLLTFIDTIKYPPYANFKKKFFFLGFLMKLLN